MPDYLKSKIYAIRSFQTEEIYIGSTVEKLSARMSKHRAQYKLYKEGKSNYTTSFKMLDYHDSYIELIEKYACTCREELERREGQYIRSEPNAVNKYIAGRTQKEYYQDNAERKKEWRKNNAERIKEYRQTNVEQIKAYYQDNAEKIRAKQKEYRQTNAERIKARKNQKHICGCGGKYTHANKVRHYTSKQHQDFENFMAMTESHVREIIY